MDKETIINPKPLREFLQENVIYVPCDTPSRIIQKSIKKLSFKEKDTGFGCLYLLENKVVLYQSIGAPAAVLSLEGLVASGAKKIVLLGFCGSLNPKYPMMKVALISKAFSEEGTSKHYFKRKKIFNPSPALNNKIESALRKRKLSFLTGILVSTDAPYRETKYWLSQKQERGIDFVDMETSAVFALAEFYSIQAAALMIISDELTSNVWKKEFNTPEIDERVKEYFLPFIIQGPLPEWAENRKHQTDDEKM